MKTRTVLGLAVLSFLVAGLPSSSAGGTDAPQRLRAPGNATERVQTPAPSTPAVPQTSPTLSAPRRTTAALVGDWSAIGAVKSGAARPVGLASADLDTDGIADVAAFFTLGSRGLVVVHYGDPASRAPYRAGDTVPSFRPEALVLELPFAPDFFGAGDFDNDGRADLLAAARGRSSFTVLLGDGAGSFGSRRTIGLSGSLAALAVGAVDREDGIADVVAAVDSWHGPTLEVHESPEGALFAKPEVIPVPSRPTALVKGELQGDLNSDIVALSGDELLIVRGRDRHLGETAARESAAEQAVVERRLLRFRGDRIVLGRFTHEAVMDIVVLDAAGFAHRSPGHRSAAFERLDRIGSARALAVARVSNGRREDLVALDDTRRVRVSTGSDFDVALDLADAAIAALPLDLDSDASQDLVFLESTSRGQLTTAQVVPRAIFFVTTTANAGLGSLRQAILDANLIGGSDQIHFAIPGPGPYVISPTSVLPTISGQVTIDGRTQPGWAGTPVVFVDGGASGGASCGLCFGGHVADASSVLGLGVVRFPGDAILFDNTWSSVVDECYLGVSSSGNNALGNDNGVAMLDTAFNRIGTVRGNLISGNANAGIFLVGGPVDEVSDSSDVPKPVPDLTSTTSTITMVVGAIIEDVNVTVNISHTSDNNLRLTLISPSGLAIQLASGVGGSGDNFTDTTFDDEAVTPIGGGVPPFTGTFIPQQALSNFDGGPVDGIWTLRIDDTVPVDSGTLNSWSLRFTHRTFGNTIRRNRIGTNAAGLSAVGNRYGVFVNDDASDVIGGPGIEGNTLSGNATAGVWIQGGLSRGHRVEGNYVGTDVAGATAVPNGHHGIVLYTGPNGCTVGGTAVGAGNVVSSHPEFGIAIQATHDNRIQGNLIGTDALGSAALPNVLAGFASFDSRRELIGGLAAGARNLISGNGTSGVDLNSVAPGFNVVAGNVVGTDLAGTAALANGNGVALHESDDTLEGNVVSGNLNNGILIDSDDHRLVDNRVGVDRTATVKIPNQQNGIWVNGGRSNSIGHLDGLANVISGNVRNGILIDGSPLFGPTGFASTDVPKPIPDLATTTSILSVADFGGILDIDVRINLMHTFDGNLDITLIDPIGFRVPLAQNRGGAGDNYTATVFDDEAATPISAGAPPFSASFRPEQPLSLLDGQSINGTWTLEIVDEAGGDTGTLLSWNLTVTYAHGLGNFVRNNFIGTNPGGSAGLGNGGNGVHIIDAAGNEIGDVDATDTNVISGNAWGVAIVGARAVGNALEHNFIGQTSATNSLGGVLIDGGVRSFVSNNNLRGNGGPGVSVTGTTRNNRIEANSIVDNAGLGIDLGPVGVTPNDHLDPDTGPNDLQNFPVITSLTPLGPSVQVSGAIDTEPNGVYTLDIYGSPVADPSGYGEGRLWLGSQLIGSGPTGSVPFVFVAPSGHGFYSATLTTPGGSTSEFSGSFALPQEVPDAMVAGKSAGAIKLTYTPACGAADHAVFQGASPIGATLSWTSGQCGFGTTGQLTFNPEAPAAGQFLYWVVVGQNFSLEGSYGQSSSGIERPEAIGLGVCEQPLSLGGTCP